MNSYRRSTNRQQLRYCRTPPIIEYCSPSQYADVNGVISVIGVIDTLGQSNNLEDDMHKVLQALVDTILLAAGSVELGSAAYSPTDSSRDMHRRAAAKPGHDRDLPTERAIRTDPQPFAGEPALRTSAEKSRP